MRKVFFTLGAIVLVAVGAAFYFIAYRMDSVIESRIERAATVALGSAVEVGGVHTDLRKGTLTVDEISVANPPGFKNPYAVQLNGLEAAVDSQRSHKDKPFRIVGILQRTGTAVDRTVHVSLAGIEAMHADWVDGRPPDAFDKLSAEEARLVVKAPERISAMLVALDQRAAALFMQARLGNWPAEPLSAVMPGPALLELWEIVGVAENILRGMSWCVITVVLVGMLTVLWSGLEERRHEMAVLRAVGARPRHIFLLIIGEALLLTLGGVVVGICFAALTLSALESTLVQQYGLSLSAAFSGRTIVPIFLGLLAAGLLAGLLPAMRCYRRSLSDGLSPEMGS